ncbi:MAG: hypothetical protein U0694_15340 [Anaerolineae bacterium]
MRLTREGAVMGTTLYMPPEMLMQGSVDQRADLYALVVFYELLTGAPPYSGSTPTGVISQILPCPHSHPAQCQSVYPAGY